MHCRGEGSDFPDNEFIPDVNNRLVHVSGVPHYLDGRTVIPGEILNSMRNLLQISDVFTPVIGEANLEKFLLMVRDIYPDVTEE